MVDLDSDPTKLIEIVEIGKQLLMTRGALTTFSIANDVAKYFAILPAMFAVAYPAMAVLNVMRLSTSQSAILSAVIFNALIIIALIPLALRGRRLRTERRKSRPLREHDDLRPGRRDRPFHRHQADRHDSRGAALDVGNRWTMLKHLNIRLAHHDRVDRALGLVYPLAMTGAGASRFSREQANGSFVTVERQGRRVGDHRSVVDEAAVLPRPSVGCR